MLNLTRNPRLCSCQFYQALRTTGVVILSVLVFLEEATSMREAQACKASDEC